MSSTRDQRARASSSRKLARAPHERSSSATRPRPRRATIATICCASTSSGFSRHAQRLDRARAPCARATTVASSRSPRYFGKMRALADLAHAVAGAADALQPARDRARRLDQQHEVDRAHVDAELERAGRDDAAQRRRLERLLDLARAARARRCRGARAPASSPGLSSLSAARGARTARGCSRTRSSSGARGISSSSSGTIAGHMPRASGTRARSPSRPSSASARLRAAARRRTVGRSCRRPARDLADRCAAARAASTIADRRGRRRGSARPPPSGRAVADSPMRCGSRCARAAASRSSDSARCAPRLRRRERVDLVDDHGLDRCAACSRAREPSSR